MPASPVPAEQPYLEGELGASIIVDVSTSYQHGEPLIGFKPGEEFAGDLLLLVRATSPSSGTSLLLNTTIIAPGSSIELDLDLSALHTSGESYSIDCSAQRLDGTDQTFSSASTLRYLAPNPFGGSTVKLDRRTGGLLVDDSGRWEPLIPTGFYTVFSDFAATTRLIDEIAQRGCVASAGLLHSSPSARTDLASPCTPSFNTLHIIPPGGRVAPYLDVLRYADSIGVHPSPESDSALLSLTAHPSVSQLYIMLDLRHAYADAKLVEEAALTMRSFKRFLLWYTADECVDAKSTWQMTESH